MDYDSDFYSKPPDKPGRGQTKLRITLLRCAFLAYFLLTVSAAVLPVWLFAVPDAEPVPTRVATRAVPSPTPPTPRGESPRYHLIVNRDTGQCRDVPDGLKAARTRVEQFPVNGGTNQFWRLEPVPGDGFRVVNCFTGQCLDVPHGTPKPHTPVEQYPINGGSNQGWRLIPVGDHWYRIENQHTGQCLEVASGSEKRQALIEQAVGNGRTNQHWRPIAVR